MPIKYREMDEITLQVDVDFAKFMQDFENYMLGSRKQANYGQNGENMADFGDGGAYGDVYSEEERQFAPNSEEFGPVPGGNPVRQPQYP